MEVASPLTVPHATAGTKRSLVCSPGLMDTTTRNPFAPTTGMDMSDDNTMQRAFKRRRFQADTTMDNAENNTDYPPFVNMAFSNRKSMFPSNGSMKRCRMEAPSPTQSQPDNSQANEIEYLKNAKASLETSLANLKTEHDKTLNENRILKRAVTIQQERQTHASNDLESARQYKVDAEENIRRLEQMVMSLRYHLQAQQPNVGNDFMSQRPPDVY